MTKWIYKITNNINGKVYIGQSNNPKRRFNEHINGSGSKIVYKAIKKYGKENFSFEIIEGPIENYNEREEYWISFYDSCKNGYNIIDEANTPPTLSGDKSPLTKFSESLIYRLQMDLIYTNFCFSTLSKLYGIGVDYMSMINRGVARFNKNLRYPLRPAHNTAKDKELINHIIHELMYSTKSVEKIARELKIDSLTVYRINLGVLLRSPQNVTYPIRNSGERISNVLMSNIIKDLLDDKLQFKDQGKNYRRCNLEYPIRPLSKKVYK